MRMRGNGLMVVLLAGTLLAGCGNSESPSGSSASAGGSNASSQGSPGGYAAPSRVSEPPGSGKPAHLSSGVIAKVGYIAITTAAYRHWLEVSVPPSIRSLISNPSNYSACIAAIKSREERNRRQIKESEERYARKFKGRKAPGFAGSKPASEAQLKLQCEEQYRSAKEQATSMLIRRAGTEITAKELGVSLNQSEVASRVKTREENQKRLAKTARSSEFAEASYSKADLAEMVKSEVLETQITAKVREKFAKPGSLSQEKLENYFNEHKQSYSEPERRAIAYVAIPSKGTAEAIVAEHGSLSAAASKHGASVSSTSVGCQQATTAGEGILAKVCAAKTGVMSGPVTASGSAKADNFYVFEVKSITPATKPNFSQVKERIK
ncbi:MAG: peptidyl-prolyl cis-trans isomerase, partial [Solirubrobacteraceae bacterium]